MLVQYLPCRYCGKRWRPDDEVSVLQSYCPYCSQDRGAEADRRHSTHARSIMQVGRYTLLTPHPDDITALGDSGKLHPGTAPEWWTRG